MILNPVMLEISLRNVWSMEPESLELTGQLLCSKYIVYISKYFHIFFLEITGMQPIAICFSFCLERMEERRIIDKLCPAV